MHTRTRHTHSRTHAKAKGNNTTEPDDVSLCPLHRLCVRLSTYRAVSRLRWWRIYPTGTHTHARSGGALPSLTPAALRNDRPRSLSFPPSHPLNLAHSGCRSFSLARSRPFAVIHRAATKREKEKRGKERKGERNREETRQRCSRDTVSHTPHLRAGENRSLEKLTENRAREKRD